MVYTIHFSDLDNLGMLFLSALWDTTQKKLKGQYRGECVAIWKKLNT
jgi:hypothetical protein